LGFKSNVHMSAVGRIRAFFRVSHRPVSARHCKAALPVIHRSFSHVAGFEGEGRKLATLPLSDPAAAAERLHVDGVVVFGEGVGDATGSQVLSPKFLARARQLVQETFTDAVDRAQDISVARGSLTLDGSPAEVAQGCGVGMSAGFRELVQRACGRFDYQWGLDGLQELLQESTEENIFKQIDDFTKAVLGPEAKLEFSGCLLTFPGGSEQLWHADGEHLFNEKESDLQLTEILPCHCLNVFIPLVDVQSTNGGTEFCLGSQHRTARLRGSDVVWQNQSWREQLGYGKDGEDNEALVRIQVQAGQVLSFDYRTLHRALAHQDEQPRPVLYFTYCKPWFSDALNFGGLPSLSERDNIQVYYREHPHQRLGDPSQVEALLNRSGRHKLGGEMNVNRVRGQFPALQTGDGKIYADGAAGTQIPQVVANSISKYLTTYGATNIGGNYYTAEMALKTVHDARVAGARLLLGHGEASMSGESFSSRITFGLNCTNLLFHLARCLERANWFCKGDNVIVSAACHDSNVSPWLILAERYGCEVRWLQPAVGDSLLDDSVDGQNYAACVQRLRGLVDDRTRIVAIGLASNATGRVHEGAAAELAKRVAEVKLAMGSSAPHPLLVLDATHYIPHRPFDLDAPEWSGAADAVVCSAYKFGGPHLGIMGFGKHSVLGQGMAENSFPVWKVGLRQSDSSLGTDDRAMSDCLPTGLPTLEGYEISRWEMGTLPFESLAGFTALVQQYYCNRKLFPVADSATSSTKAAFAAIQQHERMLSEHFLTKFAGLQHKFRAAEMQTDATGLRLHGCSDPAQRTPTFAISIDGLRQGAKVEDLCLFLNQEKEIHCTYGNHYAPELVDKALGQKEHGGVVRLSFLHYNSVEEVEQVVDALGEFWQSRLS